MLAWTLLVAAIIAEVCGTTFLKLSNGFSRLGPSLGVIALYSISIALLGQVLKRVDVGVAYALWSGLGTALVALVGVVQFGEPVTLVRLTCLGLIVAGVVGLQMTGAVR